MLLQQTKQVGGAEKVNKVSKKKVLTNIKRVYDKDFSLKINSQLGIMLRGGSRN